MSKLKAEADRNPVTERSFWRRRIYEFTATGKMLHQIIWDDSYDVWNYMQGETAGLLRRHVPPRSRLLDAGCGYGALCDCLEMAKLTVDYVGADLSPDLLEMARYRYPGRAFVEADLRALPYEPGRFDWAVARSLADMLEENVGGEEWEAVRRELSRVARRVMVIEYPANVGDPVRCRVEAGGMP
jgi:SAM-dependent methyltransferase